MERYCVAQVILYVFIQQAFFFSCLYVMQSNHIGYILSKLNVYVSS